MEISIIIPTYKHLDDLSNCCQSIIKCTYLDNIEIIIVANGCGDDGTREYVNSLGEPFNLIWVEEQIGFTKAVNIGIKAAVGNYIISLNNDTEVLDKHWEKHTWIKMLLQPFLEDENVGVTGCMKELCPQANREFLLFFCVMFSRKVIEKIGLLDECFAPAYGEDTDFCCRAEDAGFKIRQVPQEIKEYYAYKRMTGNFPLYHAGNKSYANFPNGNQLIERNNEILRQRYNNKSMVNIENAKTLDGYMSEIELRFLATLAKENKIVCECGSWHGRSTRALGDNTSGVVYAIDTWNGSALEKDTNHASAKLLEGDHALYEFYQNNFDLVQQGKIIPIRMSGKNAAKFFKEKNIQFDAVFVDAGHEYNEVREDIENWLPLVKNGGTLCGHDYYYNDLIWDGVKKAVDELLGNITVAPETSIWVYKKEAREPIVIDAFPFNNELEILDIRFETLYPVVDRFVIVEAMTTHGGKQKELVFQNNLDRYKKYLHKVTYLVIQEFPPMDESASVTDKSWTRERYQRNYIMEALKDCSDDDVIIVSDVDEIPYKEAVEEFKNPRWQEDIASLQMDLYYYNQYTKANEKWYEAKILKYHKLKELSPCGARYNRGIFAITNAGCHLSYFGGVNKIIQKIEDTAHQEYNKDEFKDPLRISNAIAAGEDLFNRENVKFEICAPPQKAVVKYI